MLLDLALLFDLFLLDFDFDLDDDDDFFLDFTSVLVGFDRKRGVFSNIFNHNRLKTAELLPEIIESDFRVLKDRLNHYYLCLPRQVAIRSENQAPTSFHSVVALDPGVRTLIASRFLLRC